MWLWALVLPFLALLALGLWRTPYGISETVAILEDIQDKPPSDFLALRQAFFRPLFWSSLQAIWWSTSSLGAAMFWFKVLHVGSVLSTVGLLLLCLRPRSAQDVVSGVFAVAVLVSTASFRSNLENLPLNQMMVVMACAAGCWVLCERAHRWWHPLALVGLMVVALGFKEQGLVVGAVVFVAYGMNAPGVRTLSAAAVFLLGLAYLAARLSGAGGWPLFGQFVGFGFVELSPEQAEVRFGSLAPLMYGYNVAAAGLQVLFSEPTDGVFVVTRSVLHGTWEPWQVMECASSLLLTTLLLAWALAMRDRWRAEGRAGAYSTEARALAVCIAALALSSALAFNYTRARNSGVAVVFYALTSYYALRWFASRQTSRRLLPVVAAFLLIVVSLWQVRALGTIYGVGRDASHRRREWVFDLGERRRDFAGRASYTRIMEALVEQGTSLDSGIVMPLPRGATSLLGPAISGGLPR